MADLLAHRVRTVALRHQSGAYIVGRPGSGKTHAVQETLHGIGANFVLENALMSPAALFDLIEERAVSVIVLDDIPTLLKNPRAVQLLMAAMGGDSGESRRVTFSVKNQKRKALFTGGIVAISNLPLPTTRLLRRWRPGSPHSSTSRPTTSRSSSSERRPGGGTRGASPTECSAVAEFVVEECRSGEYRIDLRYIFKGVEDYLYGRSAGGDILRELVRSGMRRRTADPGDRTRARQLAQEREAARALAARNLLRADERRRITGKSAESFYRRLRDLELLLAKTSWVRWLRKTVRE